MKSKAEIVLEYIKTFLWPALFLTIVALFYPQAASLLSGVEEVEVFGVKIKGRRIDGIDELQTREKELEATVNALTNQLKEQQTLNDELLARNETLSDALKQQNQRIREVSRTNHIPLAPMEVPQQAEMNALANQSQALSGAIRTNLDKTQQIVQKDRYNRAHELEMAGFTNLVNGRFHDALKAFEEAYTAFPTYHNVEEISKLLRGKIDALENPETHEKTKRELFQEILKKHTWGMPADIRSEINAYLRRTGSVNN